MRVDVSLSDSRHLIILRRVSRSPNPTCVLPSVIRIHGASRLTLAVCVPWTRAATPDLRAHLPRFLRKTIRPANDERVKSSSR